MPTMPQRYYVSFKGDRGYIDLTFTGSIAYKFGPLVAAILDPDMTVHQMGKSAAIRLQVQGFQVTETWSAAELKVRAAFAASERLITFFRTSRSALSSAASEIDPSEVVPDLLLSNLRLQVFITRRRIRL